MTREALIPILILSFAAVLTADGRVCLWVRGRVVCPAADGRNHDGRVVKVRLVDASRGTLDNGYASKGGRFALFGCHPSSGSTFNFQPELHVLHDCKSHQQRRIIIPVRPTSDHEYNITNPIDLEAYYEDEAPTPVDLSPPCIPD